ncbi:MULTISPECIES: xylulokinase [unclassified Sporolactobacillus]|uniref:xylulokinase n=1 Tax=unclassified Sporolactobacillus TaxID=2628533 RepID=UPI00236888E4|nr:xylulokinase [Sporolactobacillus sp. CQH2019]MDD9149678.1 xylulokinase [Sporolactobacillus sp. CQH2019]
MKYVIGVDLGTSSVKVLLVDQTGRVAAEATKSYPLIQKAPGCNEQDPEEWFDKTKQALRQLVNGSGIDSNDIEGLSFSGQMHGLVLLDSNHRIVRPAILWNDTRTTEQCCEIREILGDKLLSITKNQALEGFTLPKILWVKEHEPENFKKSEMFLLPKDYVRYRMTGELNCEYSDAAGTILLDVVAKKWSTEICKAFSLPETLCPPLVESTAFTGRLLPQVAAATGLSETTRVFAGGADNACGAVGAGVLTEGKALCSIGTSGVFLSYEKDKHKDFAGRVHFFNHAQKDAYYTMGVTLAAGYSLNWFKNVFAPDESFDALVEEAGRSSIGANGLLFTPYIVGERTPYVDARIRGTFTGIDSGHNRGDFARAVMEGITFSINDTVTIFRKNQKKVDTIVSIGGGAKSELWLQMQADIFNATVVSLTNEQGPGMGAAMLAAVGLGWFTTPEQCADKFLNIGETYRPIKENVLKYRELYRIYVQIYSQTKEISHRLFAFKTQTGADK